MLTGRHFVPRCKDVGCAPRQFTNAWGTAGKCSKMRPDQDTFRCRRGARRERPRFPGELATARQSRRRLGGREYADHVRQDRSQDRRGTLAALMAFVAGIVRIRSGPEFPAGYGHEMAWQYTFRGLAALCRAYLNGMRSGLGMAASANWRRKKRRTFGAKSSAADSRGEWRRFACVAATCWR